MKLFIFEGQKREPRIFKTIQWLYFKENDQLIFSFCNNIHNLYKELHDVFEGEGDIVSVLRESAIKRGDHSLDEITTSSDVSEIYLFFDYDFQEKTVDLDVLNQHVKEMLDFFTDETDNGKLYINYPMVESLRCTNELQDADYNSYVVTRTECCDFKNYVTKKFTFYKNLDFAVFQLDKDGNIKIQSPESEEKIRINWALINAQNLIKASFLCDVNEKTPSVEDISQKDIFDNQLSKYVSNKPSEVSILNSFPLFLYEYFGISF